MIVALVSGFGWHVADLRRAAEALGIDFRAVRFSTVVGRINPTRIEADGIDLLACSGVLVRMMPPAGLEPVVFRMDALHRLEALGVPVLNPPRAVEVSVDKYLASARLEAAGLLVPPTWAGESADQAIEAAGELGGDVVVKPLFGSEGRGLVRASDPELVRRACQAIARLGSVLYVQKYIVNHGHDVRAFVIGEQVIGAIKRHVPRGDWRSNVAVGGRAEPVPVEPEIESLAVRSARAVGARVAGVDLLQAVDGRWFVLEVNAVPGWKALAAATGTDVAARVLREFRPR